LLTLIRRTLPHSRRPDTPWFKHKSGCVANNDAPLQTSDCPPPFLNLFDSHFTAWSNERLRMPPIHFFTAIKKSTTSLKKWIETNDKTVGISQDHG
jgi:hypothetical protein